MCEYQQGSSTLILCFSQSESDTEAFLTHSSQNGQEDIIRPGTLTRVSRDGHSLIGPPKLPATWPTVALPIGPSLQPRAHPGPGPGPTLRQAAWPVLSEGPWDAPPQVPGALLAPASV